MRVSQQQPSVNTPKTAAEQAAKRMNEGKEEEKEEGGRVCLLALLDEACCRFASVFQVAVGI